MATITHFNFLRQDWRVFSPAGPTFLRSRTCVSTVDARHHWETLALMLDDVHTKKVARNDVQVNGDENTQGQGKTAAVFIFPYPWKFLSWASSTWETILKTYLSRWVPEPRRGQCRLLDSVLWGALGFVDATNLPCPNSQDMLHTTSA